MDSVGAVLRGTPRSGAHATLRFAQREGRVLESPGDALPPAVVVGRGQPVDTLALPAAEYDDEDLATFERLYDVMHWVCFDAALAGSIDLLRRHAIFAGLSTGGAYLAARWELRREPRGPVLFIGIVPPRPPPPRRPASSDQAAEATGERRPLAMCLGRS